MIPPLPNRRAAPKPRQEGLVGVMCVSGSDAPSELIGRREQSMCRKTKIEKCRMRRHSSVDFAGARFCVLHNSEKISTDGRVRNRPRICPCNRHSWVWNRYCSYGGARNSISGPRGSCAGNRKRNAAGDAIAENDDRFALLWVAVPVCALIIGTAAFYFASPVLLPLAIASILSVVFSPVASRLEPLLRPLPQRRNSGTAGNRLHLGDGIFSDDSIDRSRRPGLRIFRQHRQQASGAGEEHAAMASACQGSGD